MEDSSDHNGDEDGSSPSSEELLSQLMSALAGGARAVQGLPLDDEFEFQSSFPEFCQLIEESHESLLDALVMALMSSGDDTLARSYDSLDDPLLWEACADVCDALLEQVDQASPSTLQRHDIVSAKHQARTSFGRLINGIVDMEKPQTVYGLYSNQGNNKRNDRLEPFVPPIFEKYHATEQPLNLSLQPGHGLEMRFGTLRKNIALASNIVAPDSHVPHVYQAELEALEFTDWQLEASDTRPPKISAAKELTATWIDTPEALEDLGQAIENSNVQEIALDLEAHSYRSFSGITCLIQLTFDHKNYLIDPFPLWNNLQSVLGPILANPNIVKVLHGADSDVQWLQRDFGLYIVNLFDTGRAARALSMSSAGYAHLLHHYIGITADKTHQLSDWRQRPFPQSMKEYAIMDTHYLLEIYQHLKYDLQQHKTASIRDVLEESRKVCLRRYSPEVFKPDGYRSLLSRRGSKADLNDTQEQVLKALSGWRDQVARHYDESQAYVCTNQALMRLALACPTTLTTLQGLLKPMPPLLLQNSQDVLTLVQQCIHNTSSNAKGVPSSAFFKPATEDRDTPSENTNSNRQLMSPVLGTEALYRQAGWISPHPHDKKSSDDNEVVDIHTTTDEDDEEEGGELKPRRVLAVHEANRKYQSSKLTPHSLQLGGSDHQEGSADTGVDGMGPVRATHSQEVMERDAEVAQSNAAQIRTALDSSRAMIGLIAPTTDMDDGMEEDDADDEAEEVVEKASDQEEFVIPRSMREIYRISNRNRRKKKSGSPLPQEPSEKEAQELAKAEEVLKTRSLEGKNYLDEIPGTPKRQRTKSTGTASLSSEEAQTGHDSGSISHEDDIALMQDIGWVKNKEEVDSMLKEKHAADGEEDCVGGGEASSEDEAIKGSKPFDYSTIGPIGAFSATPSANPFFAGAAATGGHLNQQFGKSERKKKQNVSGKGKQGRRQVERPERREQERAQTYKKR